jgi:hypothetical protein
MGAYLRYLKKWANDSLCVYLCPKVMISPRQYSIILISCSKHAQSLSHNHSKVNPSSSSSWLDALRFRTTAYAAVKQKKQNN